MKTLPIEMQLLSFAAKTYATRGRAQLEIEMETLEDSIDKLSSGEWCSKQEIKRQSLITSYMLMRQFIRMVDDFHQSAPKASLFELHKVCAMSIDILLEKYNQSKQFECKSMVSLEITEKEAA